MPHNHNHNSSKELESTSLLALFLNILFVIIEIIGGLLTNSVAIMSDAVHDFGDVITLLISYILIKLSNKKRTKKYTFGFKSFIIVGALINTIILLASSGYVFANAISRISHPEEVRGGIMFLIAIVGVVINGISVIRFRGQNNVMSRSLMLHLLEDTLGWVAVLISSIFIYFYDLYFLDTILSFVIAGIIFINAFRNIKDIISILAYKVPKEVDIDMLQEEIYTIEGIKLIHEIRIWTLDGQSNHFLAYLLIEENMTFEEAMCLKKEVKKIISKYNVTYSVIEFETLEDTKHCYDKF